MINKVGIGKGNNIREGKKEDPVTTGEGKGKSGNIRRRERGVKKEHEKGKFWRKQ